MILRFITNDGTLTLREAQVKKFWREGVSYFFVTSDNVQHMFQSLRDFEVCDADCDTQRNQHGAPTAVV